MIVANSNLNINAVITKTEKIEIFIDGKSQTLTRGAKDFDKVLSATLDAFDDSLIMPTFGVSLHNETLEELKTGRWVKLYFNGEQTINDLPFDALLFRLEDCFGLNLIREHNGRLDGRCIYLNLKQRTDLTRIIEL